MKGEERKLNTIADLTAADCASIRSAIARGSFKVDQAAARARDLLRAMNIRDVVELTRCFEEDNLESTARGLRALLRHPRYQMVAWCAASLGLIELIDRALPVARAEPEI